MSADIAAGRAEPYLLPGDSQVASGGATRSSSTARVCGCQLPGQGPVLPDRAAPPHLTTTKPDGGSGTGRIISVGILAAVITDWPDGERPVPCPMPAGPPGPRTSLCERSRPGLVPDTRPSPDDKSH